MSANKSRSFHALDCLNFCNAGIQTGLGPFIAIFYEAVRHWNPGQIGILLACQQFAGIALQPFVGEVIDKSRRKRMITAAAAIVIALGGVGIALLRSYGLQIVVELTIGVAVTVIPPATAAFALGMVDERDVSPRIARNESFTHTGNVAFAGVAALTGTFLSLGSIFYTAAAFASGMAGSVWFIRNEDVDERSARRGETAGDGEEKQSRSWRELIADKRVVFFTVAVVLFNASNAATLPLIAQIFSRAKKGAGAAWQVALAVMAAELVMIFAATLTGKKTDTKGRKPLFIAAFAFLALRNALSVVSHNPAYLISLQALDGAAAAIYGVLLTLVTADLAKGTGRFNFLQGTIQSAMGLGGFLSNSIFGWIAKWAGFNVSFLGLSAIAIAGGLFYYWKMPETKPE